MGRQAPQKNFPLAPRTVALLKDLPVTLTVVGEGPLLAELRALARTLVIETRVQFTGAVPDCTRYMAEAEVQLCTSLHEGYPAVMVEALAIREFFSSPQRHQSAARREQARLLFARHLDAASAREYLAFIRPA